MKFSTGPVVRLYGGLDWNSPTLGGPFHLISDCVFEQEESAAFAWWDTAAPIRSGDLVVWHMPSLEPGPRPPGDAWVPQGAAEATKWHFAINGVEMLVCKYFAQRRRPDFHIPYARVVAEVRYPLGWPLVNPAESRRMAEEIRELRINPPRRPDLLVFREDLFSPRYARNPLRLDTLKGSRDYPADSHPLQSSNTRVPVPSAQ